MEIQLGRRSLLAARFRRFAQNWRQLLAVHVQKAGKPFVFGLRAMRFLQLRNAMACVAVHLLPDYLTLTRQKCLLSNQF